MGFPAGRQTGADGVSRYAFPPEPRICPDWRTGVAFELQVLSGATHRTHIYLPTHHLAKRWKAIEADAFRQVLHGNG